MKKIYESKMRFYTTRMINLNEYLSDFTGGKASGKLVIWN